MTVELSKTRTDYAQLAKELDINVDLIYSWRKEYLDKKEGSFPRNGKPKLTAQEADIALLKKQLRETELERDIWTRC